jgi:hypothetical protein
MNLQVEGPAPEENRPEDAAAAKRLIDASILEPALADAYCVLLTTAYGNTLRRLYLSLHSATAALQRAKRRGLPARLVLCKLVPVVTTDLGEVAE